MEFNKTTRAVMAIGLVAILLLLPLRMEIGNSGIYYAAVALVAIWAGFKMTAGQRSDERFYRRWEKKKQRGKLGIVAMESLKSLIVLIAIVAFGQLVVNGYGVESLIGQMTTGMRTLIAALLIGFSIVLGFSNLHEKNRKFERLRTKMER
ncbi:hypothetical protein [Saccharibacillus kuerlensis]|nr:hypothetical protein [Saccharibacillus kuerlensis]